MIRRRVTGHHTALMPQTKLLRNIVLMSLPSGSHSAWTAYTTVSRPMERIGLDQFQLLHLHILFRTHESGMFFELVRCNPLVYYANRFRLTS